MKSFKDNQEQKWTLQLTLGKVRKYREKLGIDLLNPQHYMQVLQSLTERLTFCFFLCEEQAKELGVSVDDFEERLYGEGVAAEASTAFLTEAEFFFRKLDQKALAELSKKGAELERIGITKLNEWIASGQLDSIWMQADQEMEKAFPKIDGAGSPS